MMNDFDDCLGKISRQPVDDDDAVIDCMQPYTSEEETVL